MLFNVFVSFVRCAVSELFQFLDVLYLEHKISANNLFEHPQFAYIRRFKRWSACSLHMVNNYIVATIASGFLSQNGKQSVNACPMKQYVSLNKPIVKFKFCLVWQIKWWWWWWQHSWASTYTKKWGDQIGKLLVQKTYFF